MAETILRKYSRVLPVPLLPDELEARGQSLANLCQEISNTEEEKKTITAQFKEKLDGMEENRAGLAKVIRERQEERPVECQEVLVRDDNRVRTVRMDTGVEVDSREATTVEMSRGDTLFDS